MEPPYGRNESFVTELKRLVGFAQLHQLKVVIALRTGPGRGEGDITEDGNLRRNLFFDPVAREQFIRMWKFIAKTMKEKEHVVGYDLLVEPTRKETDSVSESEFRTLWRDLATSTITAIRQVDKVTPILVEIDDWASPDALENWTPLYSPDIEQQKKIVYSVHQYNPYEYTHNEIPFDPQIPELIATFKQMNLFCTTYDVPLAVNEFGVQFQSPGATAFLAKELELLELYGMNHAIWNWEPAEASCSGRTFDINTHKAKSLLDVVRSNWKANHTHSIEPSR